MYQRILVFVCIFVIAYQASAQTEVPDTTPTYTLPATEINANWVRDNQPFTHNNLSKASIQAHNFAQDAPYLLQQLPSVVVTSDAGTGIGYTGVRIRGTDATRINVTINGIPVNDAESQQVYWVDLPDIMASAENVQVQRGVGTSTNGAGAFGATINLSTNKVNTQPYGNFYTTFGSFNTQKYSLQVGSGFLKNSFTIDGRASYITSDGYVDRASAQLQSYYLSAAYIRDKYSLRLNAFGGHEKTYQAWYGLPAQYLSDASLRTYNAAGTERPNSPYSNQIDNYRQTYFQLLFNRQLSQQWHFNSTLHYTKGNGYYEEYKAQQDLTQYNLNDSLPADLVRQRWLDNDFLGGIFSVQQKTKKYELTLGGAYHHYIGNHFGKVIWAANKPILGNHEYYRNHAYKQDANLFAKTTYALLPQLHLFGDIQWRGVAYNFKGQNRLRQPLQQQATLSFINPKVGIFYTAQQNHYYASFAIGNHEPNRDDYVNAAVTSRPQAERLYDTEIGARRKAEKYEIEACGYYMYYQNQLVLTGYINDVGEYSRVNIPRSYRIGVEMRAAVALLRRLNVTANIALSQNKIATFTEYIDYWDTGKQITLEHHNTDIAFSPNIVSSGIISQTILDKKQHKVMADWTTQFVGKQYLDNTQNQAAQLNPYWLNHLTLRYQWQPTRWLKNIAVSLTVQNLLDVCYETNGWIYRFRSDGYDPQLDDAYARNEAGTMYHLAGYFPQAGRHVYVMLQAQF